MPNPLFAIEDTNLRLAVIDRLMAAKQLPEFDKAAFLRAGGQEYDEGFDEKDYEYNDDVADALLDLDVTAEQCGTIRDLHWEAGYNDIIFTIWTYWDGESDEFHIESFEGIAAAVPGLEKLTIWLGRVPDLSPIAGLARLRELDVDCLDNADLAPLEAMTSLRIVRLGSVPGAGNLRVVEALKARGVKVDVG